MKTLAWVKIDSSNIASIAHDDETLFVEFKGGGKYKYMMVPVATYADLLESESKGSFLNQRVKGSFQYERINEEQ